MEGERMKRFSLWFLAILAVLAIGAALGFRLWFASFLKSERCRLWLNGMASRALHARGEFTPLQPQSAQSIYTDGFVARDGAAFSLLQADQIRADVRFGFWARSCSVEHLDIARLRLRLPAPGAFTPPPPAAGAEIPEAARRPVEPGEPARFALRRLTVADFDLDWGAGELRGSRLTAWPDTANPAQWLISGQGGTLKTAFGPQWRVESFEARRRDGAIYLTDSRLRAGEAAEASVQGEFAPGTPGKYEATFSGVPAGSLLPPDWRARLTGKLSGTLKADGSALQGSVQLSDGELSALPLLDRIAALTHTDGFRRMRIHRGSAQIERSGGSGPGGAVRVSQVVVESNGLLRVEGGFTLRDGTIDGTVQVGVAPATLQWIPGAREKVFTASRDGYLWTPVRLSGPADHPSEDLTARVAAAAVDQSVDAVKESVRENAKGVLDLVTPMLPVKVPGW